MCFTGANVITHDGKQSKLYKSLSTRDYSGYEIIRGWIVPTASLLYRTDIQSMIPKSRMFIYGDNVLFLTCAKYGKVHCFEERAVTYRAGVGILSQMDKNLGSHQLKHIKHTEELLRQFPQFKKGIDPTLYASLHGFIHNPAISPDKKKKVYLHMLYNHTIITLKLSIHDFIDRLKHK